MALLAALALAGSSLAAGADAPRYRHDVWTSDTGLPENSVSAIVQTRDGYLWLGTYEGLVRFDGLVFTVFDKTNTPALARNSIYSLLEDRAGALWIGTNGGGLVRRLHGAFTAYTAGNGSGLRSDVVRTLYEDRSGTLWAGTDAGLHRKEGERFRPFTTQDGLTHDAVRAIAQDRSGSLWVGTAGGGLNRFDGGSFRAYTTRHGLAHDVVLSILEDRQGRLWIGTGAGLNRLEGDSFAVVGRKDGLTSDIVTSLHEDRAGTLWVGTNGRGVNRIRDGRLLPLPENERLGDAVVFSIREDREGSLWIGTYLRGLHRLRASPFVAFTMRDGLPNDIVKAVHEGGDGSLWVATNGGGVARLRDGRFTTIGKKDGLSSDIIITAYADRRGNVWAGTYLEGLCRIRGGSVAVYRTKDGLSNNHVTALLEDREGALWIGTYGGGVTRLKDGRMVRYGHNEGLSNDIVRTLLETRSGELYVGTNEGLNLLKDGAITSYLVRDGLSSSTVVALYEDEQGALWIGTRGGGLNRLKDGRFNACTVRDGLFNDVVYAILDDGRGWLWMTSDKGIFRVRKKDLEDFMDGRAASVTSLAYGAEDGMPSAQCSGGSSPAGWRSRDGMLWFPTIRGLVGIDPAHVETNTVPPPAVVERFFAGGRAADPRGPVVLEPGRDRFEFHYTGLSFVKPGSMRFRFKLEGFDRDWVEAGTRRAAYYTNVPPGRYEFKVMASNSDGVWSSAATSLALELRPRFRQTRTFYALWALALGLAGVGAYRLRVRQLGRRERELRLLVAERTRQLQEQKDKAESALEELARAHEALQAANALRVDLLGIAAHDLKSPLQLVMGYAELLSQSPEASPPAREKAEVIYESSHRMLDLVSKLVETAVLEGGSFPLSKKIVDLAAVAEAVVAANRGRAEQKGQRLDLRVEAGCLVDGDEERLREVVDNLVGNAVKFSPRGRPVCVTVRRAGSHVRLEVKDQGPGLHPEDRGRLFGKFQRLSALPTGGESSSGLGLSIVRQLVELHGGRVSAESDGPGHGSTFLVELPVHTDGPGTDEPARQTKEAP